MVVVAAVAVAVSVAADVVAVDGFVADVAVTVDEMLKC